MDIVYKWVCIFKNRSLQFKITFAIATYVILIGIIGNMFLFAYLQDMVFRKAEQLDRTAIEAVSFQIDRNLNDVFSLAAVCSTDPEILQLVSRKNRSEREVIRDSLEIQHHINAFLLASPVGPYIDKLILFNNHGLYVYAQGRQFGYTTDEENIRRQPLYIRLTADNLPWASGFGESINAMNRQDCYILLFRVTSPYPNTSDAYIYIETGIDLITGILRDYGAPPGLFVHIPDAGKIILQDRPQLARPQTGSLGYVPEAAEFPFKFRQGGRRYRLDRMPLENEALILYNQADVTNIAVDDEYVFYIVIGTVIVSLLAAAGLAVALSAYFTRPIHALIGKIRKISLENDFSHDPEIEKRGDEIGQIGQAVNEMAGSIGHFLVAMEEQYRQQKNTEITLLQTQINPHFLYNTLDSIQWMAKIQNSHAIANIIQRLINLLRSIVAHSGSNNANESDGKITLAEELLIIEDYSELMLLRFMGSFEVINKIPEAFLDCRIPKLTLQPLVENAILHGIRPSDKFGTITLNAAVVGGDAGGDFLEITVEDSGIGMSPEEMECIITADREKKRENPSLNNIGIANVETRLKLLYGESCGLFYESRKGEYTKATVRIIMER